MAKSNPASGHKLLDNQVFRFVLSAGMGFTVDMLAFDILFYWILKSDSFNILGMDVSKYVLAFTVAFSMGVLVNFLITRFLVFSESTLSPGSQFLRFAGVATLGYFANLGILALLIKHFNVYPAIARPAAALSLFFASFFVHKLFSFNLALRHHAPRRHHKTGS
jgi:putative flippase GtrA